MIKSVLLVEDDEHKAKDIQRFLEQIGCRDITTVESLVQAQNAIDARVFEVALIDMDIPSHPKEQGGGSPHSLLAGGIEVLLDLNQDGRKEKCIIISQYPDIPLENTAFALEDAPRVIKESLQCDVLACIRYDERDKSKKWEHQLRDALGLV